MIERLAVMLERLAVGAGIAFGGYKIGSGVGSGLKYGAKTAKDTVDGGISSVCEGIEAGGEAAGTAVIKAAGATMGSIFKMSTGIKFAVTSGFAVAVLYQCRYVKVFEHIYIYIIGHTPNTFSTLTGRDILPYHTPILNGHVCSGYLAFISLIQHRLYRLCNHTHAVQSNTIMCGLMLKGNCGQKIFFLERGTFSLLWVHKYTRKKMST